MKSFKVILTEIPEIVRETDSIEKKVLREKIGKFTLNRTYRVFKICDTVDWTDFLVADDEGKFFWINMTAFKVKRR